MSLSGPKVSWSGWPKGGTFDVQIYPDTLLTQGDATSPPTPDDVRERRKVEPGFHNRHHSKRIWREFLAGLDRLLGRIKQ